jgi:hypothetical protein
LALTIQLELTRERQDAASAKSGRFLRREAVPWMARPELGVGQGTFSTPPAGGSLSGFGSAPFFLFAGVPNRASELVTCVSCQISRAVVVLGPRAGCLLTPCLQGDFVMGGNGSWHPEERKLAERLGDDYITENPPPGARIIGEEENDAERQRKEAKQAQHSEKAD